MRWKELLLTLRQDVLNDRSNRIDGDEDVLWSDATLIRYLNEAQRRFCRRSLCIRDGSTAATRITIVAGQPDYPLFSGVVTVMSARWIGSGNWNDPVPQMRPDSFDLARGGHDDFNGPRPFDRWPYFDTEAVTLNTPGKPLAYTMDEGCYDGSDGVEAGVVLRFVPVPSADYAGGQVQLRVTRNSAIPCDGDNLSTSPEIPEDYHLALVEYAASLALRIVDHELGDPVRASELEAAFNRKVEEARKEVLRLTAAPVRWGFGRSGTLFTGN